MKILTMAVVLVLAGSLLAAPASSVHLYFPEEETLWLVAESRTVQGNNLPLAAVNALLEGPRQEGLTSLIPPGVSVRFLEVTDKICFVDFSPEFNDVNYGSGPEATMLGMIVNTLTKLDDIEAVYITVEGETPECFKHIGCSGPFTWNGCLLKNSCCP